MPILDDEDNDGKVAVYILDDRSGETPGVNSRKSLHQALDAQLDAMSDIAPELEWTVKFQRMTQAEIDELQCSSPNARSHFPSGSEVK